MRSRYVRTIGSLLVAAVVLWCMSQPCWAKVAGPGQGMLNIIEPDGTSSTGCPLEHTSVKAEISGFVSRVTVTQVFHNPRQDKIEAIYTFPLPGDAAVDDMLMKVGDRVVRGDIKKREEARRIYEQARDRGQVASLLDQERPNIFTQSVANIMPGSKVEITIKYVEMLPYDDGSFKFVFPMVVGPRFIPGQPTGQQGTGWAPDTSQVPDASRITPPVTPEGTRAGHDIDITVSIDAGVPILGLESKLHQVKTERPAKDKALVSLQNNKEIPNKDFVLTYLVADNEVRSGLLTHKDGDSGYAAVILIPPKRVQPEQIAPKEMIFVIDRSGSQHGKPLEKAQETMKYVLDHMNPDDTFNVIDFGNTANMLFTEPKKNTPEYREKARRYIDTLRANGGTWMGPAVELVCKTQAPANRLRIVTFMTDGYVGNDFEIISLVEKLRGQSRWFPFGTGNSVNRFLLDQMARVGGGEVEYILLNSPGEEVAKKFYKRISTPVLTDISLNLKGVALDQVFPAAVSDLWDQKPLIFKARYTKAGKGTITLKGFSGGKPYEQTLDVTLPDKETANSALGSLWARAKVDSLMAKDWMGLQRGNFKPEIKDEIIQVALAHRIMTQFTSFVAVEETTITVGGKPTTVAVPVEMPDGVSREGVFGDQRSDLRAGRQVELYAGRLDMSLPAPASKAKSHHFFQPSRAKQAQEVNATGNTVGGVPSTPPSSQPVPEKAARRESSLNESQDQSRLKPAESEVRGSEADALRQVKDEKKKGDDKTAAIAQKMAPELLAILKRADRPKDFTEGKVTIKDGKTLVQVWLTKSTEGVLKKLKECGLQVSFTATTGKMVIGEIAVDKLADLAKIPEVRLVEPASVG
jgi:Ca-activated chloride channel homolog